MLAAKEKTETAGKKGELYAYVHIKNSTY
jgi:hypothetical protein